MTSGESAREVAIATGTPGSAGGPNYDRRPPRTEQADVQSQDSRCGSNPAMGSRSGLGTAPCSAGGTRVPGGTSVLASLDVKDRTAFDSLEMIDKRATSSLSRCSPPSAATEPFGLPAPASGDSRGRAVPAVGVRARSSRRVASDRPAARRWRTGVGLYRTSPGSRCRPSASHGTTTTTRSRGRHLTASAASSSTRRRCSSGRSRNWASRRTSCVSHPSARPRNWSAPPIARPPTHAPRHSALHPNSCRIGSGIYRTCARRLDLDHARAHHNRLVRVRPARGCVLGAQPKETGFPDPVRLRDEPAPRPAPVGAALTDRLAERLEGSFE